MQIKGRDIIKYTKIQGVELWRHLNRMEFIKLVKKKTNCVPIGIRTNGRHRLDGKMEYN